MTQSSTRYHNFRPLRSLLCLGCGLGSLLLAGGCILPSEGSRQLEIEPQGRYIRYQEEFPEAYVAPASDGGYDLVLSDGFMNRAREDSDTGRIFPSASKRVSQVAHMHVAYRPMRGSKSDFPAATNATFHWYVFSGEPAGTEGLIEYRGIGFVKLEVSEKETLFDIQEMTIRPVGGTGKLRDPLGPSHIRGVIRAQNNAPLVRTILEQVEQQVAAAVPATAPATEPSGMAPARNFGP